MREHHIRARTLLCQALARGATVVTANQRLARYLRSAYDDEQQRAGRRVWPSAQVLPWGAWLSRLWTEHTPQAGQVVLSAAQEQVIWERCIRTSAHGEGLLNVEAAARLAREAWQLCQTWSLDITASAHPLNEDTQAYLDWAEAFSEQCERAGWVSMAELPVRLRRWLSGPTDRSHTAAGGDEQRAVSDNPADRVGAAIWRDSEIILAGFDEITPAQQQLMQAFGDIGARWSLWDEQPVAGEVSCIALHDADAEIDAAAQWARHCLQTGSTAGESPPALAIVVPDLDTRRGRIERVFDAVLHPASPLPDLTQAEHHWRSRSYNLSAGRALADYPLVHDALLFLSLDPAPQGLERIGALLRSPFVAGAQTEADGRARLDARLRAWGETRITPGRLQRLLADAQTASLPPCPLLAASLSDWLAQRQALPQRQSPGRWAQTLPKLLQALGWPGERALDSLEYQTLQAFQGVLGELASLDVVHAGLSQSEVVSQLQRLCRAQLFQPEGSGAPIQVLGVLEAAGQHFDRLWLMGLHDEVWPAPPRPNPFLPIALQREHGVAHASPARELAFTRQLMARLCASADEVILSYPVRDADRVLRPSPLLNSVKAKARAPDAVPGCETGVSYAQRLLAAGGCEQCADRCGPAVDGRDLDGAAGKDQAAAAFTDPLHDQAPEHGRSPASGGTRIFAYQAACPFRAFAQLRLGATPLEEPEPGLDPRARGIVLHTALEYLWQSLGDQASLLGADEAGVRAQVDAAVEQALAQMARKRPQTFTERFTQLERDRLNALLLNWLEYERARKPFRVLRQEQERSLTLGGVTARMKIDRIDRLEDDSLAIIDYKTGQPRVADWLGERPEDPQLPLYVLSEQAPVGAVVFAQVSADRMGFKGLSVQADALPGVDTLARSRATTDYTDWPDLLAHWRATLTNLGEAFVAGAAEVDPKSYPQTCRLCPLPTLCRISEWHDGNVDGDDALGGENDD